MFHVFHVVTPQAVIMENYIHVRLLEFTGERDLSFGVAPGHGGTHIVDGHPIFLVEYRVPDLASRFHLPVVMRWATAKCETEGVAL